MNVTLLKCSPIELAELAAAVCVNHEKDTCFFKPETDAAEGHDTAKGLKHAVESRHLGVLEPISISWFVEGISRACSHQLVRHRLASYAQCSQRYCRINTADHEWYVVPPSFRNNNEAMIDYFNLMDQTARTYGKFINIYGMKKEDARFMLPNACKTNIMVTMNARSFIEASRKRLCNKAQWEIRKLFSKMKETLKDSLPEVCDLCGPPCAFGPCPERKSCGRSLRTHEDSI